MIHDFEDQACTLSPKNEQESKSCYVDHLETQLNCSLNWDQNNNLYGIPAIQYITFYQLCFSWSLVCQQCQFPFHFNGQEYNFCTSHGLLNGMEKTWCATAVKRNGSMFKSNSWQFCPHQCSQDKMTAETSK